MTQFFARPSLVAGVISEHPFKVPFRLLPPVEEIRPWLFAAFVTLLFRYTNQEDLVVGYLSEESPDTSGVPLLLGADLSDDPSFLDLVDRFRNAMEANLSHPVSMVEDSLHCSIAFSLGPRSERPVDLIGGIPSGHIGVRVRNDSDGQDWGASILCGDGRSHRSAVRFAESFVVMLGSLADNPRRPISTLPILSPAERFRIIDQGRGPTVDYPFDRGVHHLIDDQIARTPDAPALEFRGEVLSYRELGERSSALARALRQWGVGPDSLVGICLARSPAMVIAVLGILKAGGAYVPLDPAYPAERLAFMLADSQLRIVVTERRLEPHLERALGAASADGAFERPVLIPVDAGLKANHNDDLRPAAEPSGENLAYVIYTSGSTGRPKGVLIEHRGLSNYLHWAARAYDLSSGTGAPVQSPLGFDLTVTSLFLPLMTGGTVCLLPEESAVESLIEVMGAGRRFSLVKITPAHLEVLSNSVPEAAAAESTNALVIGGEPLSGEQIAFWREHAPRTRLFNEYGPTETVVGCVAQEIDAGTPLLGPVPIGRPIANTQIYILDRHLEPTPIGAPGELCIGGAGVARGYLNRADLTAAKFLTDPIRPSPGARMYRTGDLARYRDDGCLEFIGRLDHQVKIRGFRIEPGEIEAVLAGHPRVAQSLVMVREDLAGDKRLAGYVVLSGPPEMEEVSNASLLSFVAKMLPEYMIPDAIVVLNHFPLTPNGKIDREVLPAPEYSRRTAEKIHIGARDAAEDRLVKIWEEVLQIRPIGVTDNFFELGVTSLAAARLFATVEKAFSRRLPLAPVFETPTIAQMAKALGSAQPAVRWTSLVAIRSSGTRPPFFCVHGGAGTVFHLRALAEALGVDQPFYAFQAQGLYGDNPPLVDVPQMAAHYINELRTLQPEGPYYIGGHCAGGTCAFEMACQLQRAGQQVAVVVMFNALSPAYNYRQFRRLLARVTSPPVFAGRSASGRIIPRKAAGYVRRRAMHWIRRITNRPRYEAAMRLWMLVARFCRVTGTAVPESMRGSFFAYTARYAVESYAPVAYSGKVVLFRSQTLFEDPNLGWAGLVTGGLEVHTIPGAHKTERNITDAPAVEIVAERLRESLASIQRTIGGRPR